jgi:glycosyltransferase involved in cell wall biosynthesis
MHPRVTIGLPVYNGDNYLRHTLDTLLAQTFTDFELIISDNTSTDGTEAICRAYAARDPRIRYERNETNLGACYNFNRLVELARGEYFKWHGHDDPLHPHFLEACVTVLDQDPTIAVTYARNRAINQDGTERELHILSARNFLPKPELMSPRAKARFYAAVIAPFPMGAIFGLMRLSVLKQTRLLGNHISGDFPLLGELALRGRIYQVPEVLQYRRIHDGQLWSQTDNRRLREAWFDPKRATRRTYPKIRLFREHLTTIRRAAPGRRARFWCYTYMGICWFPAHILFWGPLKPTVKQIYRRLRKIDRNQRLMRLIGRSIDA